MSCEHMFRCIARNYEVLSGVMKRAVVLKALTDQILLARLDSGEMLSLSVPCRTILPGTMLTIDLVEDRCPIRSIDGKHCRSVCRRDNHAIIIEHKDKDPTEMHLGITKRGDRHAV